MYGISEGKEIAVSAKKLPSPEELHDLFLYREDTGFLIWKPNSARSKSWNTRFAGNIAGSKTSNGYGQVYVSNTAFYAHRIVWTMHFGEIPEGKIIDHINGDKADNRIQNLRLCDKAQNAWNDQSGRKVCGAFSRAGGDWVSKIRHRGRHIHLGIFDTRDAATAAYHRKAEELRGEFKARVQ